MFFKEAVSYRILCNNYYYTPDRLAELSAISPTTLQDVLSLKVNNPICKTLKITIRDFYDSELFLEKNLKD